MNNVDMIFKQLDYFNIKIISNNPIIYKELGFLLSKDVKNKFFIPLYKQGIWDGKIRFLNKDGIFPFLLLNYVKENYLNKSNYTYDIQLLKNPTPTKEDFDNFIKTLNLPFELRDYQYKSALSSLLNHYQNNELVTASGKTLIIYLITYFLYKFFDYKILILVPRTQLVEQMYDEFSIEYKFPYLNKIQRIYSEYQKDYSQPIIISTWQSLKNIKDKEIFESFDAVIVDESHQVKENIIFKLLQQCKNTKYRLGFSGSITVDKKDEQYADFFSTKSCLGEIKTFTSYELLQKKGYISDFIIYEMILNYSDEIKQDLYFKIKKLKTTKEIYNFEKHYISTLKSRLNFLVSLLKKLHNNTIILFTNIEFGKNIFDLIQENFKDKKIRYIDGTIKIEEREQIKKEMENNDDVILIASYGTFSEGINIKNVYNLILYNSYKSKIKIIQSIGRVIRKHKNKTAKIFDLIDNLSYKDYFNYSYRHYKVRKKYYNKFKIKKYEIKLR